MEIGIRLRLWYKSELNINIKKPLNNTSHLNKY